MNNAGDNTNIHTAATGRFAAAEEIIQNFYCEPYESYESYSGDKAKNRLKRFGFRNLLLYAFLTFVLILLLMPFQRINAINFPFFIFKDFIVILLLLVFLIYKNKNKYKINKNKYISNISSEQISADKKSGYIHTDENINYFRLGIMDLNNYYNSYSDYNNYFHDNNNYSNDNDKNKNRLIIGIDRKKRFEHIMIVSPTGGGKTSKYIIPSIRKDACFKNTCVYAIDIDGPYLYNAVKDSWFANSKKIVHFDPYNDGSVHFNPLIERCGDKNDFYNNENRKENIMPASDDKLYELSSMIFYADNNELKGGDIQAHKYYSKRSADILYGCLLYLKCKYDIKYFNLITAKKFFEKGFSFIEKEIKSYNGNNSKKIKEIFNNFFEIPSYERAKIITDILNGLDFIKNANVENAFKTTEKILSDGNFLTIKDLFNKNNDTLLIVSVPKEKINSGGSRLISIITDMVIKEIYENRREILKNNSASNGNKADNEPCEKANIKADVNSGEKASIKAEIDLGEKAESNYDDFIYKDIFIYLDEFPVLNINNFDIELANLRKTGTGVCISLQDISFLKNKYGDISLIDSNIGTHIIMGNAGIDTAKRYSEKMGHKYVMHTEKFNTVSGRNFKNGIDGIDLSFGKYDGVNDSGSQYSGGLHGSCKFQKLLILCKR
ncbi:MAG: hypothetical protein EVJ46_09900 [Candidatus Acididesulfobacter guangdongensis]|uniref:TraD/TraG TraM recognition site domain-containing protein n=1 Tax=Acididesulfobacter guangdongensis TaxID=2597225 RepID=A0A519BEX5_ACIG2|nr:MAG: hypothetical protein EVJ46_09900 [Candidatus Acididesulfobacter guangdongensis]